VGRAIVISVEEDQDATLPFQLACRQVTAASSPCCLTSLPPANPQMCLSDDSQIGNFALRDASNDDWNCVLFAVAFDDAPDAK